MLGLPMRQALAGAVQVDDFAGRDNSLGYPWEFAGGGGGTVRRIEGAVGPSRTNECPFPRSIGDWYEADAPVTANVELNPFDGVLAVDQVAFAAQPNARVYFDSTITVVNGDVLTIMLDVWSAVATDFNIQFLSTPSFAQWSHEDTLHIAAGWRRYKLTAPAITGLTTDTSCRVYFVTRDGVARTLRFDRVHFKKGTTLWEPYIEGTTTDWARQNYISHGSTPSDGGWTTDGLAALTKGNVLGPSGKPMSRLSEAAGGLYAYTYIQLPGFAGFVAGVDLGYRFFFRDGGRTNKIVTFDVLQFPGAVSVASVQVNVQTGECTMLSGTLKGKYNYGDGLFGVEVEGTTAQSSTTLVDVVLTGSEDGTGHYIGTLQCGLAPLGTIIDNDNLGPSAVVNSAPFGQIAAVGAGQLRVEHDTNGVALGVKVFGAATNTSANSADMQIGGTLIGAQTAPVQVGSIQGGTASRFRFSGASDGYYCLTYGGLTPGVTYTWSADAQLEDAANLAVVVNNTSAWNSLSGSKLFTAADGLNTDRPVRVAITFVADATTAANVHLGNHDNSDTLQQAAGAVILSNHQFVVGTDTDYIPAAGAPAARPAESITATDLAALGLDGDEWTVIVETQEPPATAGAYPMVFYMPAASGAVANVNKQPGGTVAFEFYDGAVPRDIQLAGRAAGTWRRYALGFSRSAGVMRAGATGEAVQSVSHANLTAFPAFTAARLGSDPVNPARIDGLIARVIRAPRLMSEAEIAERIAL